MLDKIKITQAVVVEGRCDKNVLESVIDGVIIVVNGFGVYKSSDKLEMIRRYAESCGVIILTDSDNAGRQIRDYIKNRLHDCVENFHHLYVPNLYEVEDTSTAFLREAFTKFAEKSGVNSDVEKSPAITRQRLFDDGFIGGENSSKKRKELLRHMNLPENLSVTMLLDVLNKCDYDYEELLGLCPKPHELFKKSSTKNSKSII